MSASKSDTGRAYHTQCTGLALETVKARQQDSEITLFGSCFCPFVQRVWVAFEFLGVDYKVDPYKKPAELLEVSPKGLVPGLRLERYSHQEYVQDLANEKTGKSLLPPISQPYARALIRLQADHINRTFVPSFYQAQISGGKEFHSAIEGLIALFERMEKDVLIGGASGEGEERALRRGLGLWVEVENWGLRMLWLPRIFRAKVVLTHYRGFVMPSGDKFNKWLDRLFEHEAFKKTCSTDQLYFDSYERYAFNRPNTSQVANAINQ
ncbi:hypothetical protein BDQ17DRAFT_1359943, partial [Cyathus striatus]